METGTGYLDPTRPATGTAQPESRTDELAAKASSLTRDARAKAMHRIDENKEQVCGLLEKVADSLQEDRFGSYAADYARRGAQYLRNHSSDELFESARAGVRSNPGAVLGACFVAGLAFARILRR